MAWNLWESFNAGQNQVLTKQKMEADTAKSNALIALQALQQKEGARHNLATEGQTDRGLAQDEAKLKETQYEFEKNFGMMKDKQGLDVQKVKNETEDILNRKNYNEGYLKYLMSTLDNSDKSIKAQMLKDTKAKSDQYADFSRNVFATPFASSEDLSKQTEGKYKFNWSALGADNMQPYILPDAEAVGRNNKIASGVLDATKNIMMGFSGISQNYKDLTPRDILSDPMMRSYIGNLAGSVQSILNDPKAYGLKQNDRALMSHFIKQVQAIVPAQTTDTSKK